MSSEAGVRREARVHERLWAPVRLEALIMLVAEDAMSQFVHNQEVPLGLGGCIEPSTVDSYSMPFTKANDVFIGNGAEDDVYTGV